MTMPPELPISSMLAKSFPITLQLTLIGVVFAAVVSFSLGVLAALYRDSWVGPSDSFNLCCSGCDPIILVRYLTYSMVLFGIRLVAFWWFCAIQRKPDGGISIP